MSISLRDDIKVLRAAGRNEAIRLREEDETVLLASITNTMWEAINLLADAIDRQDST